MRLDSQKELTPVIYGEFPVKLLRVTAAPGEMVFSLHWHDRLELHRVLSGSLELFCGDEQFTLQAGEVSVISPQLLHRGFAGADGVAYEVVMFDLPPLLNRTVAAQCLKPIQNGEAVFELQTRHPQVVEAVDRVIQTCTVREAHPLELVGQLYELLGLIHRFGGLRLPVPLVEERFGKVISYINERFTETISSSTLSALFGYDEAYFCRKFKRVTGMTVMQYIRILRLERARSLLLETNEPIGRIALSCGFADAAYFTNCFRRQYGVTASELRR